MANILSVQSHVAYGHVGNDAAVFPLQRLGHEAWAVHTVQFSNHTGHGAWTGQVFGAAHVREVLAGLAPRFSCCDAMLSGYLGDAETGGAVLEAATALRQARPGALWCCDPVMGDTGKGLFVRPEVAAFLAERAVPAADIVTPNQFELERLTGRTLATLADALAAMAEVRAKGPRLVVLTSLRRADAPADIIETVVAGEGGAWGVATPLLPFVAPPGGAGDALAALFLGRLLQGLEPGEALSLAVSSLFAVLEATLHQGADELRLIAEQEALVRPPRRFAAERV
jgi:pyridoxine kinase